MNATRTSAHFKPTIDRRIATVTKINWDSTSPAAYRRPDSTHTEDITHKGVTLSKTKTVPHQQQPFLLLEKTNEVV